MPHASQDGQHVRIPPHVVQYPQSTAACGREEGMRMTIGRQIRLTSLASCAG